MGGVEKDDDAPPYEAADQELRDEPEASDAPGGVGGEEMRKPRVGRGPILPTEAEVQEHSPLHLH